MMEQYNMLLVFAGVILGGLIFYALQLIYKDYIKCNKCRKWHDKHDFCFFEK